MPSDFDFMGKKKKKDKAKKETKAAIQFVAVKPPKNCKSKCCKKFKKGEHKRCKRCPMYDLLKQAKKKAA